MPQSARPELPDITLHYLSQGKRTLISSTLQQVVSSAVFSKENFSLVSNSITITNRSCVPNFNEYHSTAMANYVQAKWNLASYVP